MLRGTLQKHDNLVSFAEHHKVQLLETSSSSSSGLGSSPSLSSSTPRRRPSADHSKQNSPHYPATQNLLVVASILGWINCCQEHLNDAIFLYLADLPAYKYDLSCSTNLIQGCITQNVMLNEESVISLCWLFVMYVLLPITNSPSYSLNGLFTQFNLQFCSLQFTRWRSLTVSQNCNYLQVNVKELQLL